MSRMTIGLLSEEAPEPISDAEVAQTNLDQTKMEAQAEAIDTLKAAGQGAEEVAERLQAAPEGPAGEEAEKIAEVALEAFRRISLINQKERPALESGHGKKRGLVRELKYVGRRNAQGVSVAQEGFFADLAYGFRKTFTSWDGVKTRRVAAETKFDAKGSNGNLMVDKPYAAWVNPGNKQTISGEDVTEILRIMVNRFRSEDLIVALDELAATLQEMASATSGWYLNDRDRKKIEEAGEEVNRISRVFLREALCTSKVGHKAVIKACTVEDRKAIDKLNLNQVITSEFVAAYTALNNAIAAHQRNGHWKVGEEDVSKSLLADHVAETALDALMKINRMFSCMFNLIYAYSCWLEDSVAQ